MLDKEKNDKYGFSAEITKALLGLGYENLTEVQEKVIPFVLADQDIVVKSQTGSGKTAAFGIPVCEKIELEEKNPQALVLTPTRELAVQVKQEMSNIGRFKRIRCAAIFGRQPMEMQRRELKQRVHIIVGTPGRTLDHIERNHINLEDIKYLVIDEADKMLDMGFIEQVETIINMLPKKRVTLLFSATMPEEIGDICNKYMIHPIRIEIHSEKLTKTSISQVYYEVEEESKTNLIHTVIDRVKPESCILFCNTREQVESVVQQMRDIGYCCESLHGGLEQRERLRTIQSFKRGKFQFLVATDVLARGIHIDDVPLIVNYDMPLDHESYVHRIGRTGRAGSFGHAITLITAREMEYLSDLEEYMECKIKKEEIPEIENGNGSERLLTQNITPKRKPKIDKSEILNQEITRIRINSGKKMKMRPGDILGAISSLEGINGSDIGVIDIQDTCSYVEILGGKGQLVIDALRSTKIKGKVQTVKKVGFNTLF